MTKRRLLRVLDVRARPGHPAQGYLIAGPLVLRCALGKGGISAFKREGDGATPLATMRLLGGFRRGDKGALLSSPLGLKPLRPTEGWCDASDDRNYNRPVPASYPASHEDMWRKDHLYDVCIVLDWNIRPRRKGGGSAIFFHLARGEYEPTAGCVALKRADMERLLPYLSKDTVIRVRR